MPMLISYRMCLMAAPIPLLALTIITFVDNPNLSKYPAAPIILVLITLLSFLTAYYLRKNKDVKKSPIYKCDKGTALLIGCSGGLCLMLLFRLFGFYGNFGGRASEFNFGLKSLKPGEELDDAEENIAFSLSFNSFGHCFQGGSAIFLFAAVHRDIVLPILKRPEGLILADLLANSMIVYPVYNIVKRGIKAGSTFATSSFCNNASEWGIGVVFAVYLGLLISAISGGKTEDPRKTLLLTRTQMLLNTIRLVSGTVLAIVSIAAAILFGHSWHINIDESHTDDR
ncbi:hypothetical protein TrLO_g6472 [Triparma laevis f. longispina]|uniref:Uncharacterized protein n=1 Tax=Triparma laevis f. longispina TaxID=1714387 RepID=A0A9W7CMB3_9STRA|nr:hypothetical protein TrLO_g6472 [Triparma laevis f. longispina]